MTNPETSGWALAHRDAPKRPLARTVNFTAARPSRTSSGCTDAAGEFCIFSPATANFVFDQVAATDFVKAELPERLLTRDDFDHADDKVLAGEVIEVQTDDPDSMVSAP